jgi:isopentenyl phosphate kinase
MNLEHEVRTITHQSADALTVDQVAQKVAEKIKDEIRSIVNALTKHGELHSVHGGGSYSTHYKAPSIKRRVI